MKINQLPSLSLLTNAAFIYHRGYGLTRQLIGRGWNVHRVQTPFYAAILHWYESAL